MCGLSAQTFSSAYERAGEVFYAVPDIAGFTSHLSVMRAKRGFMVDGAALGRVRSGAVGDALGGEDYFLEMPSREAYDWNLCGRGCEQERWRRGA